MDGIVVDNHFAGYLGSVRDDDVVAYDAVVGDVRIGHDEAVAADYGFAFGGGTAVYRHTFTQGSVVANLYNGIFAVEFQVLGNGRNDCSREYLAVLADNVRLPEWLHWSLSESLRR